MKGGNRSNALLVELLIVVLFFMLASTVLMQVFAGASDQGFRAGYTTRALNTAQNVADQLYAAADTEAALADMGFTRADKTWTRDDDDFTLVVTSAEEERAQGTWRSQMVEVRIAGEPLLTLPCSRYEEGTK